MNLAKVKKYVQQFGYDDAKYRGEWKQYEVYEPILEDEEPASVGKPEFVLVLDDTIRMATEDEVFEYIDSLPEDEEYDEMTEEEKNVGRVAKTFDEILKYNPYHDARGRFTTSPTGRSRSYGSTNTGDAVREVQSGKTNSLAAHMDENGKLTPEREAIHKKIIDRLLAGKTPVDGQATMTMLGGGPASGKSSVMNPDTSKDPNSVTVDPDAIKKMLPGFSEMAAKDSNAAAYYHEESSALAKRFAEVSFSENYNVVYDGTGDGSTGSVQKKIDAARSHNYRVEGKYVSVDTETAVQRNQKRYDDAVARGETPRLPPVDVVRTTHAKCTDISVSMASKFDSLEIWDNNGSKGQQKMIATGGGGKGLTVVSGQESALQRYLDKGLGSYRVLPDGRVVPISE